MTAKPIGFFALALIASLGCVQVPEPIEKLDTSKSQIDFKRIWSAPIPSRPEAYPDSVVCLDTNSGPVIALANMSDTYLFSASGKRLATFSTPTAESIAPLKLRSGPAIGEFSTWGDSITTYDLTGKLLWKANVGSGIDWATPCDLGPGQGDGVAIAFNGGDGATLLDGDGRKLWHAPIEGNAWSVTSLRRKNDSSLVAVDNGRDGVQLFNTAGQPLKTLPVDSGADNLTGWDLRGDGNEALLGLTTTEVDGRRFSAFGTDGKPIWSSSSDQAYAARFPGIAVLRLFPGKSYAAIADAAGNVRIFDKSGNRIGEWQSPEDSIHGFCALPRPDGHDDLIMYSTSGISVYRPVRKTAQAKSW